MADELDAVLALKRFGKQYQGVLEWWPAFAGDGQGNVNTSQAYWFLARYPLQSSPTHEVFCDKINLVDNLRIIVGYTAYHPNRVEVIDVFDQRVEVVDPSDNPINPGQIGYSRVPLHWANHQYLGGDQGYINWRQITPLGVFPTNPPSLSVQIFAGYIPRGSTSVFVNSQVVNLESHIPTVAGDARYVLISYDVSGTVVITDGAINAGGFNSLTVADIPATPAGNWRSCAVILYTGQAAIVENRTEINFFDLRFPEETTAGSIGPSQINGATAQYQYIVSGATPFTPVWSSGFLNITAAKTFTVQNTLALAGSSDGFTLTIPATGTSALGAGTLTSSTTNDVTGSAHTHAITLSPALLGNGTSQYQTIVTGGSPFAPGYSTFLLDGTAGGKTVLNVSNTKTLTLTAADTYTLTIPATGTTALLATANVFTATQTIDLPLINEKLKLNVTDLDGNANQINFYYSEVFKHTFQSIRTGSTYYINVFDVSGRTPWSLIPATGNMGVNISPPVAQLHVQIEYATVGFQIDALSYSSANLVALNLYDIPKVVLSVNSIGITTIAPYSADTNTLRTLLTLDHETSGTVSNGFGGSLALAGKDSTTAAQSMGTLQWLWADATHASRKADLVFSAYDTAAREGIRIRGNGSVAAIGFLGTTPQTLPAAYTQTYATATRTHSNPTTSTLTDSSGGTPGTTLAAITGGGSACEDATKNAVASLAAQVNALMADVANVKQVLNQAIDDMQGYGLLQ